MKRLAILGSTGSIGRSTLSVVENLAGEVEVAGLAAGRNWERLAEQARKFRPARVSIEPGEPYRKLREALSGTGIEVMEGGPEGTAALAAADDTDAVLAAITGAAGLPAVMATARAGKALLLSNKESLVMAGPLLTEAARASGSDLLPVDSEHSAIFQSLRSGRAGEVKRIVLTASGGPFLDATYEEIAGASVERALQHPTWKMGPNITIDSATLMNKALEVIEAKWLFDVRPDQIDVVVHPQSIVHSLVEFVDGSLIAQLGHPDMKVPIQYALTWPERRPLPGPPLDLGQIGSLTFRTPDRDKFPALDIAYRALEMGGTAGSVFNAANEVARAAFLAGRIGFLDIARTVEATLGAHDAVAAPSLDDVLAADAWARERAEVAVSKHAARPVATKE